MKSRFKFRLSSLCIGVGIIAGLVGLLSHRAQTQSMASKWIEANGGVIEYDVGEPGSESRLLYRLLASVLGNDYVYNVVGVRRLDKDVEDISKLKGIKNLCFLDLAGTNVSDLTPLAQCRHLICLNLTLTPVSDLTAITDNQQLRELDLRGTLVNDISPLENLKKLNCLDLRETKLNPDALSCIKQVESLYIDRPPQFTLDNLRRLYVSTVEIEELELLYSFPNLEYLWAGNIPFPKAVAQKLPHCKLDLNTDFIPMSEVGWPSLRLLME